MFSIQPKRFAAAFVALLVTASVFIVSCQKELSSDGFTIKETPPDLTTKIASSVSGFVTDETDAAVEGATVQFGISSATTDKYGYFEFSNVQAVKNAAVVTVIKSGYFKGIKTYIAEPNKSGFFRIKLLPKTIQGNFAAAAGGTVTLANGLSVSFPAAAVVLASDNNTAYTGQVNVAAQWINPTANDLNRTMPGDLRGLDSLGLIKTLTTYGMAAVELTGAAGELLQVAPAKKATLTFPIPAALSSAPANLPLWSFDETKGLWKQEGYAVKSGSNYVGEVSHFSFWNCDVPNNYVQFSCTLLDTDGNPIPFALVKVSVVGNTYQAGYGYTDSSGFTGGAVPNDAQLLLEVYNSYSCGTVLYSQNFTTTSSNIALGNITVNASSSLADVSGTVTNCSNSAVTNGYIIMLKDNLYFRYPVSSTGTYQFASILCGGTASVTFIAEDAAAGEQSTPLNYNLVAGANTVGNLQACGITTEQFVNYTFDGDSYSYTAPADSFYQYNNTQSVPATIEISAQNFTGAPSGFTTIGFTSAGITAGSTQDLTRFWPSFAGDSLTIATPISVNITEYGAVGEFIAGNFSGSLTSRPPANIVYPVTCTFRIRRAM